MNTAHPLADEKYNATVSHIEKITSDLWIFRIESDSKKDDFKAGQFITIGLGSWEKRLEGCEQEYKFKENNIGKRAYSVSSPMINGDGLLCHHNDLDYFELYIALVREGSKENHSPYLTPRLFNLQVGDRLLLNPRIAGHYVLEDIDADDDVLFLATGTGQAPHNAMLSQLLLEGHRGQITIIECNRTFDLFAYEETLTTLAGRYPNVRYQRLATREGSKPSRIQKFIVDGRLEKDLGLQLTPEKSHVFLCGNPAMIGVPHYDKEGKPFFDEAGGCVELLCDNYNLNIHHGHTPGQIYFEKYW